MGVNKYTKALLRLVGKYPPKQAGEGAIYLGPEGVFQGGVKISAPVFKPQEYGPSGVTCIWAKGHEGDPACRHEFNPSSFQFLTNPPVRHYMCWKCGRRECRP